MAKESNNEKDKGKLPKRAEEMTSKEVIETVISEEVRKELDKIARPEDEESNDRD